MARRINFKVETKNACKWSKKFLSIFELLLINGTIIKKPNMTKAKKFRFININEQYDESITDLSELFKDNQELVSIELPKSWKNVKSIRSMFQGCTNLKKVIIPPTWANIEDMSGLFEGCHSLEEVNVPYSWGKIKDTSKAFKNCIMFKKTNFPEHSQWMQIENADEMFYGCVNLEDKNLPSKVSYTRSSRDAFTITKFGKMIVENPKDAVEFGTFQIKFNGDWFPSGSFNKVFELVGEDSASVNIATKKTVRYRFREGRVDYAGIDTLHNFMTNCKQLEYIELPPTWGEVKTINGMFKGCENLKGVKFPDNWRNINSAINLFEGCKSLELVDIPNNWGKVKYLGNMFKDCINLKMIILPDSWGEVEDINNMFKNCLELSDINLPNDWKSIKYAYRMLHKCSKLSQTIIMSMKIKCSIHAGSVVGISISDVYNDKITSEDWEYMINVSRNLVDNISFDELNNLIVSYGIIQNEIEEVSSEPLSEATTTMEVLTEMSSVESIPEEIIPVEIIHEEVISEEEPPIMIPEKSKMYPIQFVDEWVPSDIFKEYFVLFDEYGLVQNVADTTTKHYALRHDVEASKVVTLNALFKKSHTLHRLDLPLELTEVVDISNMFEQCISLVQVGFFEEWNKIKFASSTFRGCAQLETVKLPSDWKEVIDITSIFQGCSKLKTIKIPDSWGELSSCDAMFNGCSSLVTVKFPETWGKITSAKEFMKACDNLNSVNLPDEWGTLKDITGMFRYCDKLENINSDAIITDDMHYYGFYEREMDLNLLTLKYNTPFMTNNFTHGRINVLMSGEKGILKTEKFNINDTVRVHSLMRTSDDIGTIIGLSSDLMYGDMWVVAFENSSPKKYNEEVLTLANELSNSVVVNRNHFYELGSTIVYAPTGEKGILTEILFKGGNDTMYTIETYKGNIQGEHSLFHQLDSSFMMNIPFPKMKPSKFRKFDSVKVLTCDNVYGIVTGYLMDANGTVTYSIRKTRSFLPSDNFEDLQIRENQLKFLKQHDEFQENSQFELDFVYGIGNRVVYGCGYAKTGIIVGIAKNINGCNIYEISTSKYNNNGWLIIELCAEKMIKLVSPIMHDFDNKL